MLRSGDARALHICDSVQEEWCDGSKRPARPRSRCGNREGGVALVHQGSRLPGDRAAVSDDRGSIIQGSPNPVVPRSAALK